MDSEGLGRFGGVMDRDGVYIRIISSNQSGIYLLDL